MVKQDGQTRWQKHQVINPQTHRTVQVDVLAVPHRDDVGWVGGARRNVVDGHGAPDEKGLPELLRLHFKHLDGCVVVANKEVGVAWRQGSVWAMSSSPH